MSEVFISYNHQDREYTQKIVSKLEKRGVRCWWDKNIVPGRQLTPEIFSVIENAKAVLVIWSSNSTKSNWVRRESEAARDKKKYVPVLLNMSIGELLKDDYFSHLQDTLCADYGRTEDINRALAYLSVRFHAPLDGHSIPLPHAVHFLPNYLDIVNASIKEVQLRAKVALEKVHPTEKIPDWGDALWDAISLFVYAGATGRAL